MCNVIDNKKQDVIVSLRLPSVSAKGWSILGEGEQQGIGRTGSPKRDEEFQQSENIKNGKKAVFLWACSGGKQYSAEITKSKPNQGANYEVRQCEVIKGKVLWLMGEGLWWRCDWSSVTRSASFIHEDKDELFQTIAVRSRTIQK